MTLDRVPLADAVQRVFDGDIRNSSAVVGLLAAAQLAGDARRGCARSTRSERQPGSAGPCRPDPR